MGPFVTVMILWQRWEYKHNKSVVPRSTFDYFHMLFDLTVCCSFSLSLCLCELVHAVENSHLYPEMKWMGPGMDKEKGVAKYTSNNQSIIKSTEAAASDCHSENTEQPKTHNLWIQSFDMLSSWEMLDPGRTRACNLWFRRPTPYPLGHRAMWHKTSQGAFIHKFICIDD